MEAATSASQAPQPHAQGAEMATVAMQGELWSEAMQLKESQERAAWHEKMSRSNIEQSEVLQVCELRTITSDLSSECLFALPSLDVWRLCIVLGV